MPNKVVFCIVAALACTCANAEVLNLDAALRETYTNCVGIDDALHDIKVLAGINTAVTGVGTVAGGGALIAGIKRHNILNKLRDIEDDPKNDMPTYNDINITVRPDFVPNLKSKKQKLGNWRTGLLAVNTATNVAGTVIAAKNAHNDDLDAQIKSCADSVDELKQSIIQSKLNGENVNEANAIYDACVEYKYIDLSVLKKRAKGAEISSALGGATGAVGIITSAVANKSSGEKERKLDTASNILAGGATVLTGGATVFNAMQISAVKRVADVAQRCESLLK